MSIFTKLLKTFTDIDVDEMEQEILDSRQYIDRLKVNMQKLIDNLSESHNENTQLSTQINQLKQQKNDLLSEKETLQEDKVQLNEKVKALSDENCHLEESYAHLNRQLNDLYDEKCEYEAGIPLLQQQISTLKEEKQQLEDNNVKLEQRLNELQDIKDETPNDIEQMQDEIDDLKMQIQRLNSENESLRKDKTEQFGKLRNLKSTLKIKDDLLKEKEEALNNKKTFSSIKAKVRDFNSKDEIEAGKFPTPPVDMEYADAIEVSVATDSISMDKADKMEPYNDGIPVVTDIDSGKDILARTFFSQPYAYIFKIRYNLEKAIYLKKPKYVCKYCGEAVRVAGEKFHRGNPWHFSHEHDSDKCRFKTTTGKSKREINREKFAECNEGNRHKRLKQKLADFLSTTPGVSNVKVESVIKAESHPILRWRRPDVQASYRGQDLVFELQLSATFVSVMAERDLFYRMEHKHIIWVFNFDEQDKHLDLTNMMTKDGIFNNRLNIFVFDKEAQQKSEEERELYLKCNWLVPSDEGDTWEYKNGNSSNDLGGVLIKLPDLHFDDTYKPYYHNAERDYFAAHPEIKVDVNNTEQENEDYLKDLNEAWEQEKAEAEKIKKTTDEKKAVIVTDNGIEKVVKATQTYIIGERSGKFGLVSLDGILRIPFEYDDIRTHHVIVDNKRNSGWTVAMNDSLISIFDSNFNIINDSILKIEKITGDCKKYVKENNGNLLWGLMDKRGIALTEALYSDIELWSPNKLLVVCNGRYGIIDLLGKDVIYDYDFIGNLDETATAEVVKDGRRGSITEDCKSVRTAKQNIGEGYIKVQKAGKWGIEDDKGNDIVPCMYDDIGSYQGAMIGLEGQKCSFIETRIHLPCSMNVKYQSRDERKKCVFSVGDRKALMNINQQNKARKQGITPTQMKEAYISFVNPDRGLLYLSAAPIHNFNKTSKLQVADSDFPKGARLEVEVIKGDNSGVVVKSGNDKTLYLHRSMWGGHDLSFFTKGKKLLIEKTGFDIKNNKHIWRILDINFELVKN